MTYAVKDKSVHDGMPMEFYKFQGALRTYRFTDQTNAEVLGGETYLPIQISRGNLGVSSILDDQGSLTISLPADSSLAEDYGGKLTPTALALTVYRAYRGEDLTTQFKKRFSGEALTYGFDNYQFVIDFGNIFRSALESTVREVYYQSVCNHILYDERCKANKADNTVEATVVNYSDQAVEVDDDHWANNELTVGSIVNLRTGEERLIFGNLANIIEIGYPFVDMEVGDTVHLIRGCNHGSVDCVTKFDNYVNYGGFLYLPYKNPFENGI